MGKSSRWQSQVKGELARGSSQKVLLITFPGSGLRWRPLGLCSQQHAIFWGKKRERMMLCVRTNKSFCGVGAFGIACPITHFDSLVFISLVLKLYLPYFFFLVKDSPAMFKCWLRTKAGSEKRDWLLTRHWGGWVCPRQAKGSPSWRRGCVAFTPDQEQKAASRTTPTLPLCHTVYWT